MRTRLCLFFATALFFAGISTKVPALKQREVLLTIGWVSSSAARFGSRRYRSRFPSSARSGYLTGLSHTDGD